MEITMFCTKCGKNNPDGAAFCSGCGSPMRQSTPQPQPQSQPQPKKNGSGGKAALIAIVTLLILGLVGCALYFCLFREDSSDGKNSKDSSTATVTDNEENEVTDRDDKDEVTTSDRVEAIEGDADKAIAMIKDAVDELHSHVSWSEECIANYVMHYGGEKVDCKTEIMANVYDYDPDDIDSLRISGSGLLDTAGVVQEWTYTYKNGKATYDYNDPSIPTQTQKIDPSLFNADTLDADMIKSVKVKTNKVTFVIDSEAAQNNYELFGSAMSSMQGVDEVKYSDISVTCYIDESTDIIESYYLEFSADITVNGMTVRADYEIDYAFSPIG